METLNNDFNVQEETKQMKKLQMYQKLVLFTLLKFKCTSELLKGLIGFGMSVRCSNLLISVLK